MAKLGVNIDHVATIREARKIDYPDPVKAALMCEAAGADSIVCHLREDRRHIQDDDLYKLRKLVTTKLNLEMSVSREIVKIACDVKPDQATLVPERRMELTTEGGLDVISGKKRIRHALEELEKNGIDVSLFIDPAINQIKAAREIGSGMIELHTGSYANARNKSELQKEFAKLKKGSAFAKEIGLRVFAGHGLNYTNIKRLLSIGEIEEYNIGHSIIARAVFVGLEKAVREMKSIIK